MYPRENQRAARNRDIRIKARIRPSTDPSSIEKKNRISVSQVPFNSRSNALPTTPQSNSIG